MEQLEILCTVGGNIKDTATMENSTTIPQKIKNRITIWSSNSTSGYISKGIESRDSKRYLYTSVHRSIIHNNQVVEATKCLKCPNDGWMDKQNVVYTCNGILFNLIKEILAHATTWMKLDDNNVK